ncbi:MAG: hypothetical protein ACHQK8_09620, partial [Bacteroidia bacterium]
MFKIKTNQFDTYFFLFTCVIILSVSGCKKKSTRINIPTDYKPVKILRFERDLFAVDTNDLQNGLRNVYKKYGQFYISFAREMLQFKPYPDDSLFIRPMSMVVTYRPFRNLQKTVDSSFGEMKEISEQLGLANAIYKQEFPKATEPEYITFVSEYSFGNVTFDHLIGIGLDMFMNDKLAKNYRALEFPEFMIKKLRKEYVVPNTVKSLGISRFEEETARDKRFIATMIFEGKIRYFMQSLMPDAPDSIIMGYSAKQMQWCYDNEGEMWAHFMEKNLLYKDNQQEYMRYFNDGPFTSADGVPNESAPAVAVFTGWQIVKKYMDENPNITLQQLMFEKDFDKILKGSKYRPCFLFFLSFTVCKYTKIKIFNNLKI